jgi:hypothetical protein
LDLSPPPVSPVPAASKNQEQNKDNQKQVHAFLPDIAGELLLTHLGGAVMFASLGFYLSASEAAIGQTRWWVAGPRSLRAKGSPE